MKEIKYHFNSLFYRRRDRILIKAIRKAGFDPFDFEFVGKNISVIVFEQDKRFNHYFYHYGEPDQRCIITMTAA